MYFNIYYTGVWYLLSGGNVFFVSVQVSIEANKMADACVMKIG